MRVTNEYLWSYRGEARILILVAEFLYFLVSLLEHFK